MSVDLRAFATLLPKGRLADNVVHFVRLLRAAGIRVGPAQAIDALAAAQAVGIAHRGDLRAALGAVLVHRQDDLLLFDAAFDAFFRDPKLLERSLADVLAGVHGRMAAQATPAMMPRIADALRPRPSNDRVDQAPVDFDAACTFSPREVLRHKDFAAMTAAEVGQAKRMLARLRLPLPAVVSRRTERSARGDAIDARATLRAITGAAGAIAPLRYRRRVRRPAPLCVLCDISGSMERYSRMLLHFLHAIGNDSRSMQVLLFGTRLTQVTRHLRHRDVDVALARLSTAVADWSGGTRIGHCLAEFNRRWSRRLLGQRAVVLLITDGLDADAGSGLGAAMERLSKSARRLVWLNPLLRYESFEAKAAGIKAMLPYVDDFRSAHSVACLEDVARALTASPRGASDRAAQGARRGARRRVPLR